MSYRIEFAPAAEKQLRKLSKSVQRQLAPKIDSLATNPRPHGVEKLVGAQTLYRIRSGDYRMIYAIQDSILLVSIVKIGHRKEIYKK